MDTKLMNNRRMFCIVMLCPSVLLHFNSRTVANTFMAIVSRHSSYNAPHFKEEAKI
jgi:hypothetical protein